MKDSIYLKKFIYLTARFLDTNFKEFETIFHLFLEYFFLLCFEKQPLHQDL